MISMAFMMGLSIAQHSVSCCADALCVKQRMQKVVSAARMPEG